MGFPKALPGSFLAYLLISVAAALFLIAAFLLRKRWTRRPTRLRVLLQEGWKPTPAAQQLLLPLLVYEDDVPSFTEILGLVLESYPLKRFSRNPEFWEAAAFLEQAVYQRAEPSQVRAAMCQVVRVFLEDPDVEYTCRPHLAQLVDSFLEELEALEKRPTTPR